FDTPPGFWWRQVERVAARYNLDASKGRFENRPLRQSPAAPPTGLYGRFDYHLGGMYYSLDRIHWMQRYIIAPMTVRVQAVTVPPRLVVCHDVWSLPAGLVLKRRF